MKRKISARLREGLITCTCRSLRFIFDLPSLSGRRPALTLQSLPFGAKVAFIKPCCLGDVILATPLVRELNEARPDLVLDFVVSAWARPVLVNNPRLKELVDTGFAGSHFTLKQYFRLILRLRSRKYSAALVLDRSPWMALLPWFAGIKIRAGLDSRGRGFALNLRSRLEADDPLRHEAKVYLSIGTVLGLKLDKVQSEFFPGEASRASLIKKAQNLGLNLEHPFAVIHPGGGKNPDTAVLSKRWPVQNFAEIAYRLSNLGCPVVIIGADSDRELAKAVINEAGPPEAKLVNAAGRFDLAESGALFELAGLFIGNDTGLMHLAVACGVPTVAVFGPSSPAAYAPLTSLSANAGVRPKGKAVSPLKAATLAGLPLSEYEALSAAQGGIGAVEVERVWEAVESFLPLETRLLATKSSES